MTAENSVRKYPKKNNFTTSLASTTSLVSIGNPDGADLQSLTYLFLFSFCNLATPPQNISMTAENSVRKYPKKIILQHLWLPQHH